MIKEKLTKAERRITSVNAGQSLAAYLKNETKEKVFFYNLVPSALFALQRNF